MLNFIVVHAGAARLSKQLQYVYCVTMCVDVVRGCGGVLRLLDADVHPSDVVRLRPCRRSPTHLGWYDEHGAPARLRVNLLPSDHLRLHERFF